jgi:hypothetical protein
MPDDDEDENESSIRRACSLSDLSMGKGNVTRDFFVLLFSMSMFSSFLNVVNCSIYSAHIAFLNLINFYKLIAKV